MTSPTQPSQPSSTSADLRRGPAGLGGWLLLFLIGQSIALVMSAVRLREIPTNFTSAAWELGGQIALFRPFLVAESLLQVLLVIGMAVGLYLGWRRDPRALRYFPLFLAFVMLYGVIEILGVVVTYDSLAEQARSQGDLTTDFGAFKSEAMTAGGRMVFWGAVWFLYWRRSARVANTYGAVAGRLTGR